MGVRDGVGSRHGLTLRSKTEGHLRCSGTATAGGDVVETVSLGVTPPLSSKPFRWKVKPQTRHARKGGWYSNLESVPSAVRGALLANEDRILDSLGLHVHLDAHRVLTLVVVSMRCEISTTSEQGLTKPPIRHAATSQ